jgi:hypothetical protein
LSRWFRRSRINRADLHLVMYTRQGCHLCDDAWLLLEQWRQRYGYRLEARDVDALPELAARYGNCVPVVAVNGKVRFRGRVNKVLLQRLLEMHPSSRTDQAGEE